MSEPRADVALLVDFTDLRHSLCPDRVREQPGQVPGHERTGQVPGQPRRRASEGAEGEVAPAPEHPAATEVARHLVRFASQVGRVAMARAYADWSRCADLCREVATYNLEPILVPGTQDGEDRSHIRLVVDALEALYTGDEPDAFVLVTGDATLLPLVQKLRADGSEVVILGPSHSVPQELRKARPIATTPSKTCSTVSRRRPRVRARGEAAGTRPGSRARAEARARPDDNGIEVRREHPQHPTPVRAETGFDEYDWEPFVRLIDELEHRLPFVGVRYLVNKVLGAHNCGVEDPRIKRDLINRAVDDELIEMYPVANVGNRADPVTACRLNRVSVQHREHPRQDDHAGRAGRARGTSPATTATTATTATGTTELEDATGFDHGLDLETSDVGATAASRDQRARGRSPARRSCSASKSA